MEDSIKSSTSLQTIATEDEVKAWKDLMRERLVKSARRWCKKTPDIMSNMANISALIYTMYNDNTPQSIRHYYSIKTIQHFQRQEDSEHLLATTRIHLDEAIYPSPVNWSGFYLHKLLQEEGTDGIYLSPPFGKELPYTPVGALFLGPFMGLPAVPVILPDRGVCGATLQRAIQRVAQSHELREESLVELDHSEQQQEENRSISILSESSILVKDVHQFPGHIACDAASASELVVPVLSKVAAGAYAGASSPKFTANESGSETRQPLSTELVTQSNINTSHLSVAAILDLDSPYIGFFDELDIACFATISHLISTSSLNVDHISTSPVIVTPHHLDDPIFTGDASCSVRR